jgi:hypothetical protein
MPRYSILFGALLITLGLVAYLGSDLSPGNSTENTVTQPSDTGSDAPAKKRSAITGLAIPASFGVLLLVFGLIGLRDTARKHAMHGAALVGTLGAVLTIGKGSFDLYKLVTQQEVNARALTFVWLMAILCTVFVLLCVQSFISARKKQSLQADGDSPSSAQ